MSEEGPTLFDMFLAIQDGSRTFALLAWDHNLNDVQVSTLRELGIDREGWTIRFGHRLVSEITFPSGVPKTTDDLSERLLRIRPALPELASAFVRELHGEVRSAGSDSLSEDAALFAVIDAKFREAASEQPSDDPIARALRRPLDPDRSLVRETPFDSLIRRLTPKGDRIVIGPFALAGGLELMGMAVIAVLAWIPLTLASSWRLVAFREVTAWTIVKAGVGWLVILLTLFSIGRA